MRVFACGGADVPPAPDQAGRRAAGHVGDPGVRLYGVPDAVDLAAGRTAGQKGQAPTGALIGAAEYRIVDDAGADLRVGPDRRATRPRGPSSSPVTSPLADNVGAFTPDGWFRTGDLAVADRDGYVSIRGRKKDIILRGGENISATEVESLLFEHPAVREAAVVAMPDPVLTERGVCLCRARSGSGAEPPGADGVPARQAAGQAEAP